MNLPGKITISRTTTNQQQPDGTFSFVRLELTDVGSGITFVVGTMTLADFAMVVTGHASMPIEMDVRWLESVGLIAEHKTELVEYTGGRLRRDMTADPAAAEAARPYEVDGWRGRWTDLLNSHNRVTGNTFRVGFDRFVPRPEAK